MAFTGLAYRGGRAKNVRASGILLRLIFLVRDKVVMRDEIIDVKFDEPIPAGALSLDDGG